MLWCWGRFAGLACSRGGLRVAGGRPAGGLRRAPLAPGPSAATSPLPARPWQALLSRGDRRLTPLLLRVRGYGDSLGSFRRAFKELAGELPPMEWCAPCCCCRLPACLWGRERAWQRAGSVDAASSWPCEHRTCCPPRRGCRPSAPAAVLATPPLLFPLLPLPPARYVSADYDPEATLLPWAHLHGPLPAATLRKHLAEAQAHMAGAGDAPVAAAAAAVEPEAAPA